MDTYADGPARTTRERILTAARGLFDRNGFRATSIRAIARASHLSDAAVHYHFRSKEGLLQAVLASQIACARTPRRHEGACVTRACLIDCILQYFLAFAGAPTLLRTLLREQVVNEPTCVASGERLTDYFFMRFAPAFAAMYADDATAVQETIDLLLSGVLWDQLLQAGDNLAENASSAAFASRVRQLIELALPPAANAGAIAS